MVGGEDKRLIRINLLALHHFSSGKLRTNDGLSQTHSSRKEMNEMFNIVYGINRR